jgi:hypothetical protein
MNEARREGREVTEVFVRLQKDEVGYPPKDWESLKAESTSEVVRIKSIPFFARGLAYLDEVRVSTSVEGYYPCVESVAKRSGYSTMRLLMKPEEDKDVIIEYFTRLGCLLEFSGRLAAIAIPRDAFEELSAYICDEKARGRWGAEDGYLVIDE